MFADADRLYVETETEDFKINGRTKRRLRITANIKNTSLLSNKNPAVSSKFEDALEYHK